MRSYYIFLFALLASLLLNTRATIILSKSTSKSSKYTPKKKQQKLSLIFMIKSFFISMVDPEYGEPDALGKQKASKVKGGAKNTAASQFGLGFSNAAGGGSFGSVCGPGGCK